ncbi:MAG: hypothetical protein HY650_10170 [Acidobacteria bacterium]|nr:hypothetical protein [Acidobacteriota bacterium]
MTRLRILFSFLSIMFVVSPAVPSGRLETVSARLKPETIKVWEEYQRLTESRISAELGSPRGFMVQDFLPDTDAARCRRELGAGQVFDHRMETRDSGGKRFEVPGGMIHHWLGSIFLPRAKLADVIKWFEDYNQHYKYFEEVEASRLLSRQGEVFNIFLRLKRTKILTVRYNTEHTVEYRSHGPGRTSSRSRSTRIAEVEDGGSAGEREKPPGDDRGFLWRLNAYWRCQQEDGGVTVNCESISLSRGIPTGLGWLIKGYVESVPKDSLVSTLTSIRQGTQGRTKR